VNHKGIVAANYGKELDVLTPAGDMITCELARDLGDKPVAGDRVSYEEHGDQCYLTSIEPRERIIRRAGGREGEERILAAHVDLALVISSVKPKLKEGLIDRYLVALHQEGIEPLIVLNKKDLDDGTDWARIAEYTKIGYKTFLVCATSGDGVDALRDELHDQTCVLVGHSGVGKSTLLMKLLPEVETAISEVSEWSGKGVHTTSTARLYAGPDGMRIIDSPGIRAFGLAGITPPEVGRYFIEFEDHASHCRFRDCLHMNDDGCAVRAALDRGEIGKLRYESYVRIVESLT